MKRKTIGALALGLIAGFYAGCQATNVEHVSAEEFQDLVIEGQRANSAYWIEPIGVTGHRAYLEHGYVATSIGQPRAKIIWTESELLPEGYLDTWMDPVSQPGE